MSTHLLRLAAALVLLTATGCAAVPERTAQRPYLNGAAAQQLRSVSAAEARRAGRGLVRCERRGAAAYRHCAIGPLGRAAASAAINGRMLFDLAEARGGVCHSLAQSLAGESVTLGGLARSTLANAAGSTWHQVRAASRAVRGLARDVLAMTNAPAWDHSCADVSRPL